jgi:hypothetical protein
MDKLQLTRQNLGQVIDSRSGCMRAMRSCCYETKLSILNLKTGPKQLEGYLPLDIVLPTFVTRFQKKFFYLLKLPLQAMAAISTVFLPV